ncbi:MAG: hypothetical protein JSV29_01615 [Candidatus Bathyarchaeota archaeon]|nr:MAG: hypothetical protein JSV29_01615 [Candidatus Bathyarchaeota archaeon]
MNEITVRVEADINPTEDPNRVKRAIENIMGNAEFDVRPQKRGSLMIAEAKGTEGLTKFQNLLRRERIRNAARGVLFQGLSGKSIIFYLNKQVAYVGHLSFSQPTAESPLGPIRVQIRCDKPREIIEWLAPRTA